MSTAKDSDIEAQLEALRELSERHSKGDPVARYRADAAAFEAADLANAAGFRVPPWAAAAIRLALGNFNEQILMLQEKYNEKGNPMLVCQAYLAARFMRQPLPEWILEYFDNSIKYFWNSFWMKTIEHATDDNPQEAMATAFGLNVGRGESSVWSSAVDQNAYLGAQVALFLLRSKKPSVEDAVAKIADRYCKAVPKVKRAWQTWARENPVEARRLKKKHIK